MDWALFAGGFIVGYAIGMCIAAYRARREVRQFRQSLGVGPRIHRRL